MPISKHFKGHGDKVMDAMKKSYGKEKGKKVFYATENKNDVGPSDKVKKKHGVK